MTIRQVLSEMRRGTWLNVRPLPESADDILVWSDDWYFGSGYPEELGNVVEWDAGNIHVEWIEDPAAGHDVPMIVVEASDPNRKE